MNTFYSLRVLLILVLYFPIALSAKVLFMTHCFNKPEFIAWQHAAFKKFMKEEYEFIVFNDAPNDKIATRVQTICDNLGIRTIRVPQHIHKKHYLPRESWVSGASAECAETIQYMFDTVGFYTPGIVAVVDSDMFLIREFNATEYLQDYEIAANPQLKYGNTGDIVYLLPNLIFFNMDKLADKHTINFGMGTIDGARTDTAGNTHYYLKNHPNVKWLQTNCLYSRSPLEDFNNLLPPHVWSYLKSKPKLFQLIFQKKYDYEFYNDSAFIHFRAGSNWDQREANEFNEKTKLFIEAFDEILQN